MTSTSCWSIRAASPRVFLHSGTNAVQFRAAPGLPCCHRHGTRAAARGLTAQPGADNIVLVCPMRGRTIEPVPLRVQRDGPLPIAEQIAEQLMTLLRSGRLRAVQRLPPVRVLAGFRRANRNTGGKGYAVLARPGKILNTASRD